MPTEKLSIAILGWPDAQLYRLREAAPYARIEQREQFGSLRHLVAFIPRTLEDTARLYTTVWKIVRLDARSLRESSGYAMSKIRYKDDPECLRPRCNGVFCNTVCAKDMWTAPYYWKAISRNLTDRTALHNIEGDCDDIELLSAGMGELGSPLFVRPSGGKQGHVLHLNTDGTARDYCVRRGMGRWRGRRPCFYVDGNAIVEGVISPGNGDEIFKVEWNAKSMPRGVYRRD